MREFEHHITDFSGGLRRFKNGPLGALNLVRCQGLEIKNKALAPMAPVVNARPQEILWPFPQYFVLSCCTVMMTKTQLYEVGADWTPHLKLTLPESDYFTFADFGLYIVGSCSNGTVFRRTAEGVWELAPDLPEMTYVTNFRGQLVGAQGRKVIWSAIGRADFTLNHTNEAGNFVAPWNCDVTAICPIGDVLMVFGELGVLELKPVTDPAPTFAIAEVADFGLANPKAVCGGGELVLFLDNSGTLHGVDAKSDQTATVIRTRLRPVELGYREFFELFDLEKASITYDPIQKKFYISDGEQCYVFSNGSLTEAGQIVTSSFNGVGVCTVPEISEALLVTDLIDFGIRGLKTLNWIELGVESPHDVSVALFWRMSYQEPFQMVEWRKVNKQGQLFHRVTALDFRIGVKVHGLEEFRLDRITIRLQLSDRRTLRGTVNVGQITS